MLEKLNAYAMALLTVSVAVSSIVHVLGFDKTKGGSAVLKVCFDAVGLLKAVINILSKTPPVVVLLLILGVGASQACSTAPKAPDTTATACQRALVDLRNDRDAGLPCEAAKARARVAEPLCPLAFECGRDAGHE